MITASRVQRDATRSDGAILIETVIVALLLAVLAFGAIEYGWMFYCMHVVSNSAQVGARTWSRLDATEAGAIAAATAALQAGGVDATPTVTAAGPTAHAGPPATDLVTVTVSVSYADLTILDLEFLPRPASLTASVTMAKDVE